MADEMRVPAVVPEPMPPVDEALMTGEISGVSSGTSRVNGRGLHIAFTVIGLVLAFIVWQLATVGDSATVGGSSEPVLDSLDSARLITSNIRVPTMPEIPDIPTVLIPEAKPEPPAAPPPPPPPAPKPAPPAPRLSAVAAKPEGPDPLTLEMMRLEGVRQKQYEAAITGDVMVRLDHRSSPAQNRNPYTPPGGNMRSRKDMLAAVDAELARTNALIAEYGNDATAAYQRQIAQIQAGGVTPGAAPAPGLFQGGSSGGGGASGAPFAAGSGGMGGATVAGGGGGGRGGRGNSLADFDGDASRWALSSEMENPSQFLVRAGSVIPAVLLSGINSDLPGQIMAQVSQNVYDTPTGRYLLIPQGTRLIGGYSSEIQYGQNRVFVAWQRLVFPDGRAYDLGSQPGTTGAGYAGLRDRVNMHFVRVFGSALLMSAIVGGISYSQDQRSGGSGENASPRMSDSMSEALGQQMGQVTVEMIRRNMNISPTIEIRPGFRLNVMLVKDVAFRNEYKAFDYSYANR